MNEYKISDITELLCNIDRTQLLKYLDEKNILKVICDNDIFYNNIASIIKINGEYLPHIIKKIMNYDEEYILNNAVKLLPFYINDSISSECIFLIRKVGLGSIVNYLKDNKIILKNINILRLLLIIYKDNNYVKENIDYFINNTISLLDLKELFLAHSLQDGVEKINYILDNDISRIVLDAVYPKTGLTIDKLKNECIYDTVRLMIEELVTNENIKFHEIKHLDIGGYSNVINIGSKILKLGKKRNNFNIKNNKRFLAGLRGEIKSLYSDEVVLCYEITEMVDTKHNNLVNIYELYKELRAQGLIWVDCHKDNIGILLKDNKVYFKGFDSVDINATGYTTENNDVLKKGDVVIIDNDYIFTEKEFQELFNNNKSLQENISSLSAISDLEYQYQIDKLNEKKTK